MPQRLARKLLVVGWDAADWTVIDLLISHGAMPTLKGLVDGGVRANLASLEPRLSPLLWTSVATGKTADKHGILNFVEADPGGGVLRIIPSTSRTTKALWNILSQSRLRTRVVNWYASHPAEPIAGVCVSNLFQEGPPPEAAAPWPMPAGAVHPASLAERVADLRLHPREVLAEEMRVLIPELALAGPDDPRPAELARRIAQCSSVHNVATALLEDPAWDCTMVFYDTIDVVGHHFMQFHPPRMAHVSEADFRLYRHVMHGVYQIQDMMLGTLMRLAGPDTTVVVLSDHGFQSGAQRPVIHGTSPEERAGAEASWHRPLGVLAMGGPGIRKGQRAYGANLLDVAPTALALLGIPVGADMDGRVLSEAIEGSVEVERVFSWDTLDGEAGLHPAGMRLDPSEAQGAIDQLVDLGYLAALPEGEKERRALVSRETRFNLAVVYMTTRRPAEAAPIFERLLAEIPGERRFTLGLARCRVAMGELDACRVLLEPCVTAAPGHAEVRMILAVTLARLGEEDRASALLAETEPLVAGRPELAGALGETYATLGRWGDAKRHFMVAVGADPENARAWHGLGVAALAQERFEEAAARSLDAVGLMHFFPDAHYTLGVALAWMQDYAHATRALEVAVSMEPGHLNARRYLASLYRRAGDADRAREHRDAAERITRERAAGRVSLDSLRREAPMGPQEWAKRMGTEPPESGGAPA